MTSAGHQPSVSDSIGIVRRGCSSSNARNPRVLVCSTLGPGEARVTIRHDFSLLCPLCCDTMPAPPRSVRTAVCTRPYLSGGQYFGAIFLSLRSKCDFDLSKAYVHYSVIKNTATMRLKYPCYAYDTAMPQYMLTAYAWCNEMNSSSWRYLQATRKQQRRSCIRF